MSGDKPHTNGSDPSKKGTDGSQDVDMKEQSQNSKKTSKPNKDKDGDDEMTVVVPPSKGSSAPTAPDKATEADLTNGAVDGEEAKETEPPVDPQEKAISGKALLPFYRAISKLTRQQRSKPTFPYWSAESANSILDSACESFAQYLLSESTCLLVLWLQSSQILTQLQAQLRYRF